jgi:hypothetical protein
VRHLPQAILVDGLGLGLIGFGLYRLLQLPVPTLHRLTWAYPFGLVAGVLGGAYNTGGPPIVLYATMNRWPPETFLATLQSCFVVTGLGVIVSHGWGGLWTGQVFQLFALSLPIVLLSVGLGAG